jgi:hypothetical protein
MATWDRKAQRFVEPEAERLRQERKAWERAERERRDRDAAEAKRALLAEREALVAAPRKREPASVPIERARSARQTRGDAAMPSELEARRASDRERQARHRAKVRAHGEESWRAARRRRLATNRKARQRARSSGGISGLGGISGSP